MTNESIQKQASRKSTPPSSFVKLAMRNMVRKGSQSLIHFAFTAAGLFVFIVLLAWFARPNIPS